MIGGAGQRIYKVLEMGPRKLSVLRALIADDAEFERAVGQLFIAGVVSWFGKGKGRTLGRRAH
jgi:hypothetical protein